MLINNNKIQKTATKNCLHFITAFTVQFKTNFSNYIYRQDYL